MADVRSTIPEDEVPHRGGDDRRSLRWGRPRSKSRFGLIGGSPGPGVADDSKKLEPAMRERLCERMCATAQVGIAFGSRARIDCDNIRQAALWALARASRRCPCVLARC
jgi:ribonuclease HII